MQFNGQRKKSVLSRFKTKFKKSIAANHGPANQNIGFVQKGLSI